MEEAEAQLRGYIEAQPDNTQLKFALVDFLKSADRPDESAALLAELAESKEQEVALEAKNKIATDLLREEKLETATLLIDEILAADERNTAALIKRSSIRIDAEDFDNAIVDLRTALDNDPDSTQAMMMMASAFERQNNMTFAQAELAKAFDVSERDPAVANHFARFLIRTGNIPRAEEVLVDSLAAHEGDLENLRLLAGVRLNRQDWRGAEELAQLIAAIEEETLDEGGLADTIRGAAFSGLGEFDRVIETLGARSEAGPIASQPLATLVNAYMQQDRTDEAEELLNRIIASGENPYEARILLARVYASTGRGEEVETVLIEAAEREPTRAAAYELLYRYYSNAGQPDRAAALIDEGLEKAPDNISLKILKADASIASGDMEEALTIYEGLLEERPNDVIIANNFVSLSSDLRLDADSIARALEVSRVVQDVSNPLFKDTVGWAHYRAGQYDEAVQYLTEAAEGAPDNAEILYHLGAAQAATGDVENARATLQKALEAGGDSFVRLEEAQTILQGL